MTQHLPYSHGSLAEAYGAYASNVEELREELRGHESYCVHPDYLNYGNSSIVFRREVNGLDVAMRLPNPTLPAQFRGGLDWVAKYERPLTRTLGKACTEQGIAAGRDAIISHYIDGRPYLERASEPGIWLPAKSVLGLMDTAASLADVNVARDDGSPKNTLMLPNGTLVCIDNVAKDTLIDPCLAAEKVLPMILNDMWYAIPRIATVSKAQHDELTVLVNEFANRFPNSRRNQTVQDRLARIAVAD